MGQVKRLAYDIFSTWVLQVSLTKGLWRQYKNETDLGERPGIFIRISRYLTVQTVQISLCLGRLSSAKSGSPALDEDSAPETEFSTGSPTYNQGQNQMYRDCLS